ncbi:MAG: ATP-binding protein [Candidatus Bathyarchaeota archaeon]|jgi:Cdc6-like AAA superfamily ATPase|nr:ATP-binding protein [Candidatus Bathyarchaeum sp.]
MGWIQDLWSLKKNPFSIRELNKSEELQTLFVNRKREIRQLINTLTGSEGGVVYGINGMRGVGKSTVLNKILSEIEKCNGLVIKVRSSGTYTELDFLSKLLTDICDQIEIREMPKDVKKELVRLKSNLLYNEKISKEKTDDASIRSSIKASFASLFGAEVGAEVKTQFSENIERELKPYSKASLTREILQFLKFLNEKTDFTCIVIGIDETDKCRFKVAEELLDSLKVILSSEDCHFVFVGTLKFHSDFAQAFCGREEEATLSSIFEGEVVVNPLTNKQMMEIIEKRLQYFCESDVVNNPFSQDALNIILELSSGNPKKEMRLCSEGFNYFGHEGKKIQGKELIEYYQSKDYIPLLSPTEQKYLEVINKLGIVSATSENLFEKLAAIGTKHNDKKQYRVNLENLVGKKYLEKIVVEEELVKYKLSTFCEYVIAQK